MAQMDSDRQRRIATSTPSDSDTRRRKSAEAIPACSLLQKTAPRESGNLAGEGMMDGSDREHTRSGTRLAAFPADDRTRIEYALAHAESHVARMPPSPVTQHLKDVLEFCHRTVDGWTTSPPADEELRSVRERAERALQIASTSSPTVRVRRQA